MLVNVRFAFILSQHLNISRCCLQPICSECFVQIKRLDPHPPHDDQSNQEAGNYLID